MNTPKLSIMIPNYNHGHFLRNCVERILSNGCSDLEIIILDDASTDDSHAVIAQLQDKFTFIRAVFNDDNVGVVQTANEGLQHCRGKYIHFCAADDVVYPGFYEQSLDLLEQHPQAVMCCSDPCQFTSNPDDKVALPLGFSAEPAYLGPGDVVQRINGKYIHTVACVYNKQFYQDFGGEMPDLDWAGDWMLNHVVAFRKGFCYFPDALAGQRIHPDTLSGAAMHDPEDQRRVWGRIIELLRTEYRDVLPCFMRSGIMNCFVPAIMDVLWSDEKFWNVETLALLMRPAWAWNQRMDAQQGELPAYQHNIPPFIRHALQKHESRIRSLYANEKSQPKIYVYGAGKHTEILLNIWDSFALGPLSGIITTEEPQLNSFKGLPLMKVGSHKDLDLIIISSRNYEREMVAHCKALLPHVPRITIWEPEL